VFPVKQFATAHLLPTLSASILLARVLQTSYHIQQTVRVSQVLYIVKPFYHTECGYVHFTNKPYARFPSSLDLVVMYCNNDGIVLKTVTLQTTHCTVRTNFLSLFHYKPTISQCFKLSFLCTSYIYIMHNKICYYTSKKNARKFMKLNSCFSKININ
jgi:hypothetical protein